MVEAMSAHQIFYRLLANNTTAGVVNLFVWFSLTFWIFLETNSVLITSLVAGTFIFFGDGFGATFWHGCRP